LGYQINAIAYWIVALIVFIGNSLKEKSLFFLVGLFLLPYSFSSLGRLRVGYMFTIRFILFFQLVQSFSWNELITVSTLKFPVEGIKGIARFAHDSVGFFFNRYSGRP